MTEEKKKIIFIVNPKAGISPKSKFVIELLTGNIIPSSKFISEVVFTEYAGHGKILAKNAVAGKADIIVAVGGDGTVNEIACSLVDTNIPMGILPSGSGNGLARCLGISMTNALALRTIIKGKTKLMDVAMVNNLLFTSIAGIGFDAHVAQKFADSGIRGLFSYMRIILTEFRSYKPLNYSLSIDGQTIEKEALMITFANSNQFGFHTRIAPDAKVDDGFLDICIVRKMPASKLFNIGYRTLTGTLGKTGYAEYYRGNNIMINNSCENVMNIDGEPKNVSGNVQITVKPLALRVIVP